MTQSSKVLTVSYGAFSCTLEGFDDSVEAMKAITEYFRELAAEDRYFGVEPPQSQAETAARLARHDIARRMDAHDHDGGLLVRPRADLSVAPYDASSSDLDPGKTAQSDQQDFEDREGAGTAAHGLREVSGADSDPMAASDAQGEPQGPDESAERTKAAALAGPLATKTTLDPNTAAKLQRIRDIVGHRPETSAAADGRSTDTNTEQDDKHSPVETSDTLAQNPDQDGPAEDEPDRQISTAATDSAADRDDLQIGPHRIEDKIRHSQDDPQHAATDTAEPVPLEGASPSETNGEKDIATTAEQAEAAPRQAVRGRVLKVDRADLDAALAVGEFTTQHGEPKVSQTSEARLPPVNTSTADDVSRLMAEAEQKMEDPDGTTRRDAFAHLRAAVAARSADKSMQAATPEDETTRPYRRDLAQAIKPRRPVPDGQRTQRPTDPSTTPLKLAPEQRVDDSKPKAGPVTPRRIAAEVDADHASATDIGFAAFAEACGATQLPELLEAAAAHMRFVEGREVFSRPQLMTRVRQADAENFRREEALRGFAQLLQTGKIEKIGSGRFQAADTIGFRPDNDTR